MCKSIIFRHVLGARHVHILKYKYNCSRLHSVAYGQSFLILNSNNISMDLLNELNISQLICPTSVIVIL